MARFDSLVVGRVVGSGLFVVCVTHTPLYAFADVHYETVIRAAPSLADQQDRLDAQTPGFATAVDIDKQRQRGGDNGLANALARTVGVTLRSSGALGQFSSVSIRGSSAQQLAVFLDGVPLSGSIGEAFDLSGVSLDVLRQAAVYRGYTPVPFVLAGLGGVVSLSSVSASGDNAHAGLAGGSYGSIAGDGHVSVGGDTTRLRLGASAARSSGRFSFYDDNGTPNVTDDDRTSERINDDYRRVTLHGVMRTELLGARLSVVEIVFIKDQGIPGPANAQAAHVRLGTEVYHTIASLRRQFGSVATAIAAGVGIETRRFRDPDGEIGARSEQRVTNLDLFVSPTVSLPLWPHSELQLTGSLRREHTHVDQAMRVRTPTGALRSGDAGRTRDSYGVGAEVIQHVGPLRLTAGARLDGIRSDFAVGTSAGELNDQGRNTRTTAFTPRVGAVWQVIEALQLRGSFGRYVRAPTLNELFGDRGFVLGNEGLRPESGWLGDLGARFSGVTGIVRGRIEVVGYASHVDDLINYQQAGVTLKAFNTRGAMMRGLEVSGSGDLCDGLIDGLLNYVLAHTENHSVVSSERGQQLPGRPNDEIYAELGTTPPLPAVKTRLYVTADISTGLNLDPSGRFRVPPRALFGSGAQAAWGDFSLGFAVQNLFDKRTTSWRPSASVDRQTVPISDFIGYPLPGRSFWLRGAWRWQ